MRRRSLLFAFVCFGCAGPRQPPLAVTRVVAAPSTRVVQPAAPRLLGVPAEARTVYNRADSAMLGLVEVGGRTLIVSPEIVAPARVEKSADGYVLHAGQLAKPPEQEPQLSIPELLQLRAPSAAQATWQLNAGAEGPFAQLRDPFAERLSANLEQLELEHVDTQAFEVLWRIRHYLHLLRDQPADELREIVSNIDPDTVKAKGGANAYVGEQLWMEMDKLRPSLANGESAEFERYSEMAKGIAYKSGAAWPPAGDAFLEKLALRLSRTDAKVTIRDGALMRVDTKDRKGVSGCDLGVMLPEPTENRGRPWLPFTPPAPGKLGAYTYVMFVLQAGLPGDCEQLRASDDAYPVRHGVYYFRLFGDAQAKVRGALFIGYMGAELYVAHGASEAELMAMLRANSEEISHQAE